MIIKQHQWDVHQDASTLTAGFTCGGARHCWSSLTVLCLRGRLRWTGDPSGVNLCRMRNLKITGRGTAHWDGLFFDPLAYCSGALFQKENGRRRGNSGRHNTSVVWTYFGFSRHMWVWCVICKNQLSQPEKLCKSASKRDDKGFFYSQWQEERGRQNVRKIVKNKERDQILWPVWVWAMSFQEIIKRKWKFVFIFSLFAERNSTRSASNFSKQIFTKSLSSSGDCFSIFVLFRISHRDRSRRKLRRDLFHDGGLLQRRCVYEQLIVV